MSAEKRVSAHRVLTWGDDVDERLNRLAEEDAAERGQTRANRSATVAALVVAEDKRRARRREKSTEG